MNNEPTETAETIAKLIQFIKDEKWQGITTQEVKRLCSYIVTVESENKLLREELKRVQDIYDAHTDPANG